MSTTGHHEHELLAGLGPVNWQWTDSVPKLPLFSKRLLATATAGRNRSRRGSSKRHLPMSSGLATRLLRSAAGPTPPLPFRSRTHFARYPPRSLRCFLPKSDLSVRSRTSQISEPWCLKAWYQFSTSIAHCRPTRVHYGCDGVISAICRGCCIIPTSGHCE